MDDSRPPNVQFSVFTKPWRMPLAALARHVRRLGFAHIELPVRPGFQVEPQNIAADLPRASRVLREEGVNIASIAGPTDEAAVAACASAGVPLIRTMVPVGGDGYLAAEARARREFNALTPVLARYAVKVGVQNHCDRYVCHALGLRRLLEACDPAHVVAVWDAAHNALQGEDPELAIEIVWPCLGMVNLKNAVWERRADAGNAPWQVRWTSGREGLASWPRVAAELNRRRYSGMICLTAEYSAEEDVDRLIVEDLAFAKSFFPDPAKGSRQAA